jgi:hypothetical protein
LDGEGAPQGVSMSRNPFQKYTLSSGLSDKYPTISLVMAHLDFITESIRDEVFEISIASGKSTNFHPRDFDDAYTSAVRVLKGSLAKDHLAGTKRCKESSASAAIRWIRQRLISSVKNHLTNEKDKNFIPNHTEYNDSYTAFDFDSANQIKQFEIESDLKKIDRDEIERGLRLVWTEALTDHDFDWLDFVGLCEKYDFDANEISKSKSKAEIDSAGFSQLVFDFEDAK